MKKIMPIVLGILMLAGAFGHFLAPEFYAPMIPDFISDVFANISSGIVELLIGIALLIPSTRKLGGLAFMLLMIAFLPLHVWDVVRSDPIMGSAGAAVFRLLMQFGLIYAGFWIWRSK